MNFVTVNEVTGTNTYTYTVPAGVTARLAWVHAVYTSDATVGNRQVVLKLTDASDNLFCDFHAGAVQAASLARHYSCIKGIYRETAFVNGAIQVPIAQDLVLPEGFKIVLVDTAGISASDSMAVDLQYEALV